MRRNSLRKFLSAAILMVCHAGLVPNAAADPLAPISPTVPMPAFTLPGLNGTSGSDADLRNKVTIIRFWASW